MKHDVPPLIVTTVYMHNFRREVLMEKALMEKALMEKILREKVLRKQVTVPVRPNDRYS